MTNIKRRKWLTSDEDRLKILAEKGRTAKEIAIILNRTEPSIFLHARKLNVSFSQSPLFISEDDYTVENLSTLWSRRVAQRLKKDIKTGCVLWTGSVDRKGYGQIRAFGRKLFYIHRLSLQIKLSRMLLAGECALHSCDNPLCCNEDHLFVGTQLDNIKDMNSKGRTGGQFEKNHKSFVPIEKRSKKFTEETVRNARLDHEKTGLGYRALSRKYGMSRANMRSILRRRTWKHVS